ncbi:MAG: Unknown protein [uncultured Sulfurovum sp.]|uniref:Uncharacterized protein n=1 Tax=uncultured Sulfurovum sp. TaxID=269237 RepID=A0A6S6SP90_9BACT|nr:MAG: Unknown protein [uncultured Sulfurovum sp.]
MNKKVIIASSIILALAIGIKIFLSNAQETVSPMPEEIKNVDAFFSVPLEEEKFTSLVKMDEVNINETVQKAVSETLKETKSIHLQTLYHEINKEDLLKKMPHKKLVAPVLGIKITENSIAKLSVGDVIKLPALGQVQYEAEITKVLTHKNGSTSATGNLIGDQNEKHSIILTEGKSTSYASISTPEGAFEIETIDGVGYVYSVKDIEDQYIDRSKEDILHPPHKD